MTARIIALAASLPRGLRARPWPAFVLTLAFAYGVRHVDAGHARRRGRLRALRAAAAPALAARLDAVAAARVHVRLARARRDQAPRRAPRAGAVRPGPRGADLRRRLRARGQPRHGDRRAAARRPVLRPPRRPRPPVRAPHGARRPRRARRQPPHLPARHDALARRTPWAAPEPRTWRLPVSLSGRVVLRAALGLVLAAPVAIFAATSVQPATAALTLGEVCPDDAAGQALRRHAPSTSTSRSTASATTTRGQDVRARPTRSPPSARRRRSRKVSIGLRDDPIQPLVIRANEGDCVEITLTNNATGGDYGMHIDGLAFDRRLLRRRGRRQRVARPSPAAATRTYRYYVPDDSELEGTHYMRPGPGNRDAVAHGLFGALVVEPAGSTSPRPRTPAAPLQLRLGGDHQARRQARPSAST